MTDVSRSSRGGPSSAQCNSFVIEDATVIDGTERRPAPHSDVIVRGGRVASVEPCGSSVNESLEVIDGRGRYVMPGMWETQAHLTRYANGIMEDSALRWPQEGDAEILEANVRSYLRNGFTTVVDLGGPTEVLAKLRVRLERGEVLGAHLLFVGRQIVAPGGLPRFGDRPVTSLLEEVDGPAGAVATLNAMIELGINAVKINHTPGFELFGTGWPLLDTATLTAIIDHAHAAGLPVLVHIDDPDSAAQVLELGVDGIEHSFEAPPDRLQHEVARITDLCLRSGAFWSMTVAYLEAWARAGDRALLEHLGVRDNVLPRVLTQATSDPRSLWVALPGELRVYFRRRFNEAMTQLGPVHRAGVRMTISTDSGNPCTFHGLTSRRELELMAQAGVPPADIVQAATRLAAEKFRCADDVGTIEPGKRADLLLLRADPLADIANVASLELVFRDGVAHIPSQIPV
jgi:imidazolonepropionase-like amidohydrolase